MLPEINVHRPRGVRPRVAVRQRTVVDYQPSWLLLALPVVAVASARRRTSGPPPVTDSADAAPAPVPDRRRGPARYVLVGVTRMRRRPAGPDVVVVPPVV